MRARVTPLDLQATIVRDNPTVRTIEGLLTEEECDVLIRYGEEQLQPSTVSTQTGDVRDSARTSTSAFLPVKDEMPEPVREVVRKIEDAMRLFCGVPLERMETFQLVKYEKGEEYKAHMDWFEKGNPDAINQRTHTGFLYLNSLPPNTGDTIFPRAKFRVTPEVGKLVIWENCSASGDETSSCDPLTEHLAQKLQSGTKYGLNCWVRGKKAR